jgi:hypothetical protein
MGDRHIVMDHWVKELKFQNFDFRISDSIASRPGMVLLAGAPFKSFIIEAGVDEGFFLARDAKREFEFKVDHFLNLSRACQARNQVFARSKRSRAHVFFFSPFLFFSHHHHTEHCVVGC